MGKPSRVCPICNGTMLENVDCGCFVCPNCHYEIGTINQPSYKPFDTKIYDEQYGSYLIKTIIAFVVMLVTNLVSVFVQMPIGALVLVTIINIAADFCFSILLVHAIAYKCVNIYHSNTVITKVGRKKDIERLDKRTQNQIHALERIIHDLREQVENLQKESDKKPDTTNN